MSTGQVVLWIWSRRPGPGQYFWVESNILEINFCLLEKLSVYSDLSILLVIGGSWSGWVGRVGHRQLIDP